MKFASLIDLFDKFPTEESCRDFLVQQRWNGKPVCPHCGYAEKAYVIEGGKRLKCGNKECYKKYSVTVGTFFENSNIDLRTWFAAMYLITAHKKGISSAQLARDLNVHQKTAWFILHRIRGMVFGALEVSTGQVKTKVLKDTTGKSLQGAVKQFVHEGSIMVSDDHREYSALKNDYHT